MLALGGALAACFLLPATDGLSGGSTGPSDAASEPTPVDGAVDGGCDATFCDDFDNGPLGAAWTEIHGADAGWLSLGAPSVSPPNALEIALPDAASGTRMAMLVRDLPKGSALRCSFSVLGEALSTSTNWADVLSFHFAGTGAFVDAEILLGMSQSGVTVREDVSYPDGGCGCPEFEGPPIAFSPTLFTKIAMTTDFSAVRLYVNDVLVDTHAVTGGAPAQVRVSFGMRQYGGTATRARFDDFACTVTP